MNRNLSSAQFGGMTPSAFSNPDSVYSGMNKVSSSAWSNGVRT